MEPRDPVPRRVLRRWHRLHFWHSLLCNGRPNSVTDGLWTRMEAQLHEIGRLHGTGNVLELPRVKDISPEEFYARHIVPNKPVVLAGAAKTWKCVEEWSPQYFAQRYGEFNVTTAEGRNWGSRHTPSDVLTVQNYNVADFTVQDYSVADLVADIERGGSRYASFYPFFTYHPELMEHFDQALLERYFHMRKIFPWQRRIFPKLFLGGAGTSTPTHCAGAMNLFVQIYGKKQWDLWHPHAAPFLYPEFGVSNNIASLVDFREPDYERYPLFRYPDRYRTVLEPGDILFIPPWWWHGVQNLTTTVSVSNFVGRLRSVARGMSFFVRTSMDPWTIAVFLVGNENVEKEWELMLPRLIYRSRGGYVGTVTTFARFLREHMKTRLAAARAAKAATKRPAERSRPVAR